RISGAGRGQLLGLVLFESLLLCVVGFILGTVVGRIGLWLISNSTAEEYKMEFNPFVLLWDKEGILFLITIFVGVIAALIPAINAYKLNISQTLNNAQHLLGFHPDLRNLNRFGTQLRSNEKSAFDSNQHRTPNQCSNATFRALELGESERYV